MSQAPFRRGDIVELVRYPKLGVGVVLSPGRKPDTLRVVFRNITVRDAPYHELKDGPTEGTRWVDEAPTDETEDSDVMRRKAAAEALETAARRRARPWATQVKEFMGTAIDTPLKASQRRVLQEFAARRRENAQPATGTRQARDMGRVQDEQARDAAARARRDAEEAQEQRVREELLIEQAVARNFLGAHEELRRDGLEVSEETLSDARTVIARRWFQQAQERLGRDVLPNLPDEEQLRVIAEGDRDMLVVARAGSGKTATIVNRAWFLVEHAGVDPSEILVLAFNKAAAHEVQRRLRERMGEQAPLAATFHSLAARVRSGGPAVTRSEPFLRRLIEASLSPRAEREDGGSFRKRLWEAMKLCWSQELTAIVDGGHHLSDPEMMAFRRAHPVRTLRGNNVPSAAHKAVADALFSHDLKYKYKKRWRPPHFEVTHPERHIVVWIACLDCHAPPPGPDAEAAWTDERTRAHWANKKATIALEFDARNTGRVDVEAWLRDRLAEHHVYVSRLDERVLWERCRKRVVGDFTRSAHAFVQHARKRELTADQLDDLLKKHPASDRTTARLHELVGPLYARYLKQLEAERRTDFDGLLMDARRALRDGATVAHFRNRALDLRRLRYLFVDEYQDFSRLFERFVSTMSSVASELSLCCVGDDWQAINGFAGSDLQYFRDFFKKSPGRHHPAPDHQLSLGARDRRAWQRDHGGD